MGFLSDFFGMSEEQADKDVDAGHAESRNDAEESAEADWMVIRWKTIHRLPVQMMAERSSLESVWIRAGERQLVGSLKVALVPIH